MRNGDIDLGTPAVPGEERARRVSLTVDGHRVTVPEGTSIMRAAAQVEIPVPKLCATDSLQAFGSCRLCLVEIEGRRGLHASCTEPVQEGMAVQTQNDHIADIRRGVMELYISDHPLDCLTCSANGDCELQDMAGAVGLREVRYQDGSRITWTRTPTHRTPTSRLILPSASSVRVACAPVTRCKAHLPSPLTVAVSAHPSRPAPTTSFLPSAYPAERACRRAPRRP